jgi:hypothetical protein
MDQEITTKDRDRTERNNYTHEDPENLVSGSLFLASGL